MSGGCVCPHLMGIGHWLARWRLHPGAYGVGSQAPMGHLGQPFSGGYLAQSSPFWASGLSLCSGT